MKIDFRNTGMIDRYHLLKLGDNRWYRVRIIDYFGPQTSNQDLHLNQRLNQTKQLFNP